MACASLPALLRPGDLLVLQRHQVDQPSSKDGELLRLDGSQARLGSSDRRHPGSARGSPQAARFVRNAKRLRDGDDFDFGAGVTAIASERASGRLLPADVSPARTGRAAARSRRRGAAAALIAGKRAADSRDRDDYQTMFAREKVAVAVPRRAPFHPGLMAALAEAGIAHETLTLHVGAVLPPREGRGHTRIMSCTPNGPDRRGHGGADQRGAGGGGRIIPVGTTSLRLLESAADETGRSTPSKATPRSSSTRATDSGRSTA